MCNHVDLVWIPNTHVKSRQRIHLSLWYWGRGLEWIQMHPGNSLLSHASQCQASEPVRSYVSKNKVRSDRRNHQMSTSGIHLHTHRWVHTHVQSVHIHTHTACTQINTSVSSLLAPVWTFKFVKDLKHISLSVVCLNWMPNFITTKPISLST